MIDEHRSSVAGQQKSDGFTLIEIMIALAIIGTALTVLIHTVNYHATIMYENTLTTRMYQMAKERMYQLEQTPQDSEGNISEEFTYKTIISPIEDSNLVELKTIVSGQGKQVVLNELVIAEEGSDTR
jgi:prepilin-type N-terminal cleavage/methylation domain-containing protein